MLVACGVGPECPVLVTGESAEFGFNHDVGPALRLEGGTDAPDQGDVVLVRQRGPVDQHGVGPGADGVGDHLRVGGVVQLHRNRNAGGVGEAAEGSDQPQPVGRGRGLRRDEQDGAAAGFLGRAHDRECGGEVVARERRHGRALLQGGADQGVESGTHQAPRPPTRIQATNVRAKPASPSTVVEHGPGPEAVGNGQAVVPDNHPEPGVGHVGQAEGAKADGDHDHGNLRRGVATAGNGGGGVERRW